MSRPRLAELMGRMVDACPWMAIPRQTVDAYLHMLRDLDPDELELAVEELLATASHFPPIAEIRTRVFERKLALPLPEEAWGQVLRITRLREVDERRMRRTELAEPVLEALELIGGTWVVRTSDRPEALRSQFLQLYERLRTRAIEQANLASLRGRPAEATG